MICLIYYCTLKKSIIHSTEDTECVMPLSAHPTTIGNTIFSIIIHTCYICYTYIKHILRFVYNYKYVFTDIQLTKHFIIINKGSGGLLVYINF